MYLALSSMITNEAVLTMVQLHEGGQGVVGLCPVFSTEEAAYKALGENAILVPVNAGKEPPRTLA